MNAVEIEQAISDLALQPFDAAEFPYAFLAAFGNKEVTLKRLRSGNNNTSDMPGGVLLRNNIHIATCEAGNVSATFTALLASTATIKGKAKFVLASDGRTLEAQELASGETIVCAFEDFPNHFGFLLPLAGISTIKEIKDNPIDVRATGRLNKLYVDPRRALPGRSVERAGGSGRRAPGLRGDPPAHHVQDCHDQPLGATGRDPQGGLVAHRRSSFPAHRRCDPAGRDGRDHE